MSKEQILALLKIYCEYLYIQNIIEYFSYGKVTSIPENSSEFTKGAFKLNQMVLNKKPANEVNEFVKELKQIPLTYGEMRSFFG